MLEMVAAIVLIPLFLLIKLAHRRDQTTRFGAPYVAIEPGVVDRIIDLAEIAPGDVYFDLGSGDGRLVIAAAMKGACAYGVEVDFFRVWYSRFCIFIFGLSRRAKIIHKNFFDVDLSSADVITTYLLQETNDLLFDKLARELKPRSRIVSAAFNFPKWTPVKIDYHGTVYGPLHLYHLGSQSIETK